MSKHLSPTTFLGGLLLAFAFASNTAFAINITISSNNNSGFNGAWCAQGNPGKRASIVKRGSTFVLTNELGSSANGHLQGAKRIIVPGWRFVKGTLTDDGRQINWSNGTYWRRCYAGGRGGPHFRGGRLQIGGTWYAQGNPRRICSINQFVNTFSLRNETGSRGDGSFTGKYKIRTTWNGKVIRGRISRDGNRINWDNGTYWIRASKFR